MNMQRWRASLVALFFAATPVHSDTPEFWVSKTSAIIYRISLRGRHLTAKKVFSSEFESQVEQGAFVRCDYVPQGDAWAGKCESRLPFEVRKDHVKWCKFKFTSRITLFTPSRIEGQSAVWANDDVDADKCELKRSHAQRFIWIPKL